ncbi:hypothetical protein SAMN05216358_3704 [Rhizobium sp. AN5]|uniref:hypothetical protein n=1 Tax=Rhizobium sp. AN5 TaxID=1855304 RepID=UPI000BD8FFC5|nr:hypothetical protein [Rhizobium sp. AN5]SOC93525.1 hypothetical protein SAMN05216358_3704 [Rhizobium sp. AN5]
MLLKPSVLEDRGISVTDQPADGDYMDIDQVELSTIDRRLIEKALATPDFKEVYAYAGPERFWTDPNRTSGASMQMLYSDDLKQAPILYLDPGLSDVVIGSVSADDPAEALHEWSIQFHARGASPVIGADLPPEFRKKNQ